MTKIHVERPTLPWRIPSQTICGRLLTDVDQYIQWLQIGDWSGDSKQVCSICLNRSTVWSDWNDNPVLLIQREAERFECSYPSDRDARLFNSELQAIAQLVAIHRGEFDQILNGERPLSRLLLEQDYERRRRQLLAEAESTLGLAELPSDCEADGDEAP